MANERKDPFRGYNFALEIEGISRGGFREASGLDSTQDAVDYREGNFKTLSGSKLYGLVKYSNIVLKWGITTDDEIWKWRQEAATGKASARKSCSVVLLDDEGAEKIRWNLNGAWPSKWTGPTFNATSNEVAIESLEITHEGVEKP